jgi:hypothetical protein
MTSHRGVGALSPPGGKILAEIFSGCQVNARVVAARPRTTDEASGDASTLALPPKDVTKRPPDTLRRRRQGPAAEDYAITGDAGPPEWK